MRPFVLDQANDQNYNLLVRVVKICHQSMHTILTQNHTMFVHFVSLISNYEI